MTSENPYPGPQPFKDYHKDRFFGRKLEERDIASLIIANPSLLLYGKSGTGKTSLLQAAIIPRLENHKRITKVYPPARVQGHVGDSEVGIDSGSGNEEEDALCVYMMNVYQSWIQSDDTNDVASSYDNRASLAQNLRDEIEEDDRNLTVLVFDQFEELFNTYHTHWTHRERFFEQISDALRQIPTLRVVFSMREDYIADFYRYSPILPDGIDAEFQLQLLEEIQARLAIREPVNLATSKRYKDDAVDELIQRLRHMRLDHSSTKQSSEQRTILTEFVEPVVLQVVCQKLWNKLDETSVVITKSDVIKYADVGNALEDFYQDCIESAVEETQVREAYLRNWFDKKLIADGQYRRPIPLTDKGADDLSSDVVNYLVKKHILRRESGVSTSTVELVHDLFIAPINNNNRAYFEEAYASEVDIDQSEITTTKQLYRLSEAEIEDTPATDIANDLWEMVEKLRSRGNLSINDYVNEVLFVILTLHLQEDFQDEPPIKNYDDFLEAVRNQRSAIYGLDKIVDRMQIEYRKPYGIDELIDICSQLGDASESYIALFEAYLQLASMRDRKRAGDITTPLSLTNLLVACAEHSNQISYSVCDPLCRSGSFLIHITERPYFENRRHHRRTSLTGFDLREETLDTARMRLLMRGYVDERHYTLKARNVFYDSADPDEDGTYELVLCNPPFSDSSIGDSEFAKYDMPIGSNDGNYVWIQYFTTILSEYGRAAFLMPNSASDARSKERDIRQWLFDEDLVDVIISIGNNFFYSVTLPCTAWILDKTKRAEDRTNQLLLIDAREIYVSQSSTLNVFQSAQIEFIANIVRLYRRESPVLEHDADNWLETTFPDGRYEDVLGLCKVVNRELLENNDWSFSPSRYVGSRPVEDSMSQQEFWDKMDSIQEELERLIREANRLENIIRRNFDTLRDSNT